MTYSTLFLLYSCIFETTFPLGKALVETAVDKPTMFSGSPIFLW